MGSVKGSVMGEDDDDEDSSDSNLQPDINKS